MSEIDTEQLTISAIEIALKHNVHPYDSLRDIVRLLDINHREKQVIVAQCELQIKDKEKELPFSFN